MAVNWDPATGKGAISLVTATRQKIELRFQDGFKGYTGGLYPGSMNRPAVTLYRPGLDKKPAAIWCAQDESIWDHERQVEFSPGWSENFGHGPDGRPLTFQGGRIIKKGAESVILASMNSALPYEVNKWMSIHSDGMMLVRTQIRNISHTDVIFDFWSGDDPWVGDYGTSRGDVGWENRRWIKREQKINMALSRCVGIADLQEGKWDTANYMCLSAASPLPTATYFANRFAHADTDISAGTLLDSETMTAFNMGWQNISLAPNESFEISYALGAVPNRTVQKEATVPSPPEIPAKRWAALTNLPRLKEEQAEDAVIFKSERVEMHLEPERGSIRIEGIYTFQNKADKEQYRQIYFPFAVDELHPYPHRIHVEGIPFQRFRKGILFPLQIKPGETAAVKLSYEQKSADNTATYIVTSARTWNNALEKSVLVVESPNCRPLEISYPMKKHKRKTGCHYQTILRPFWPDREFTVRWN